MKCAPRRRMTPATATNRQSSLQLRVHHCYDHQGLDGFPLAHVFQGLLDTFGDECVRKSSAMHRKAIKETLAPNFSCPMTSTMTLMSSSLILPLKNTLATSSFVSLTSVTTSHTSSGTDTSSGRSFAPAHLKDTDHEHSAANATGAGASATYSTNNAGYVLTHTWPHC